MKEADPLQDLAGGREDIRDITRILKTLSADLLRLVAVEARLFGHTAVVMLGLTVVLVLLLVSGWLFIGAALAMALASLPYFSTAGALLTVALAHLALAGLAFWRLRSIRRDLTFRESRASVNDLLTRVQTPVDSAGQRPPAK